MNETQTDIQRLSPDECIKGFTASPIVMAAVIAAVFHGVVIGGSAVLETFVFTDEPVETAGAGDTDDAPDDDAPTDAAPTDAAPGDKGSAGATDPVGAADSTDATDPADATDAVDPEQDRINNTPVMREITDVADDNEIPEDPDLGISIEDTNP